MKHKRYLSLVPAGILGLLVSIMISVLGIVVISWLIQKEVFDENIESWMLILIWFASAICGAAVGGMLSPDNRIVLRGFIAAGYIVLLCGIGIMIFNEGFYRIGIGIISVLGSYAVLLGLHYLKNKKSVFKKRYKYR